MNGIDILVLCLLALALFFAVRAILKRKGKGCSGNCGSCGANCPHRR